MDEKSREKWSYWGQGHRKCYYEAQIKKEKKWGVQRKKKLSDEKDKIKAKSQENCNYCEKPLLQKNFRDAVKDHCHITGRYRGAAHRYCNNLLRIYPKTEDIAVVFHNLKGYDAHHLMQAVSQTNKEVKNCIVNNMEKYITFSVGGLRFIDSLNFLHQSLNSLVNVTPKELLKFASTISKGSDLLYKKGIYPYEYMDSWERFTETRLPDKENFYSKLSGHITEEEYAHAQAVWEAFGCKTLGDYHDLYVKTDVALLADVFENFRKPMPRSIRVRSSALFDVTRPLLGRALEKDEG